MATTSGSQGPNPAEYPDELTSISSIDITIAQKLATIDITQPAELAAADATNLAQQLNTDEDPVTPDMTAQWVTAAQRHCEAVSAAAPSEVTSEPKTVAAAAPESPSSEGEPAEADPTTVASEAIDPTESAPEGITVGRFEITIQSLPETAAPTYQTTIQNLETDAQCMFEGLLSDRLQTWIQGQLTTEHQETAPAAPEIPPSVLKVTAVSLLQNNNPNSPISVDIPHQSIPPALSSRLPMVLEVSFDLTSWGQWQLRQSSSESPTCQVQIFAKPLSPIRSRKHWLEAANPLLLTATQTTYTTRFQPTLLEAGMYSLQILLLSEISSFPVFLEVPVFQVR
ncbi:MAG: hypothetical protein ACFBSG_05900 [Leptolyngbyaceae cyanobacterium]